MEPTQRTTPEVDPARTTGAPADVTVAVLPEEIGPPVAADPSAAFRVLPEPVRLEDTVPLRETVPAPDPTMGRDTEKEFMLRYI